MSFSSEARRRRLERAERECAPGARRKVIIKGKKRFTLLARNKREMKALELQHEVIQALTGRGLQRAALGLKHFAR